MVSRTRGMVDRSEGACLAKALLGAPTSTLTCCACVLDTPELMLTGSYVHIARKEGRTRT